MALAQAAVLSTISELEATIDRWVINNPLM
jgi:hypothetical protein